MRKSRLSRREILKGASALALGTVFASPARAEAPPPEVITPQLVEAAKKEAKVVLYSAMDLPVGERLGKAFETQYPDIQVQIERSGSERLFQRINQEFASNIRAADVASSAVRHRRHCPIFSGTISRSRRDVRDHADLVIVDRLQHQPRQT